MDEPSPSSAQPELARLLELVLQHIEFNQLARVTLRYRPGGATDDLEIRPWIGGTVAAPVAEPKTLAVAKPLGAQLRTYLLAHDGRCLRFLNRHLAIHDALEYTHEAKFSCVLCHLSFTLL